MMYEITENTKSITNSNGDIVTLHQIKKIENEELGGWIENKHNLSQEGECFVYDNAMVYGDALVYGNAKIYDNAKVYDNATVVGNAEIYDRAEVYGFSRVYENAQIFGNVKVCDNAVICDNAMVYQNAIVCDNATIFGNTRVMGNAKIYGNAVIYKDVIINGNLHIKKKIIFVNRSDGYNFILAKDKDDKFIISAGCRYFTFEEAWKHWKATRSGTVLGEETFLILEYLEKVSKLDLF